MQTVYFPKLNFFKNITAEMIKSFMENSNRSSIQTKLNSLLSVKEDMYLTLKQLYQVETVYSKIALLKYLFMYPKFFQYSSIILGIIMNILILVSYTTDDNPSGDLLIKNTKLFMIVNKGLTQAIFRVVGFVLLGLSGLVFAEFLTRKAPLIYRKIIVKIKVLIYF